MRRDLNDLPDWERLLAAERHVQHLVPGSVLIGGTAAALHAGHRRSSDGDHVCLPLPVGCEDAGTMCDCLEPSFCFAAPSPPACEKDASGHSFVTCFITE